MLDYVVGELTPLPQAAITFLNSKGGTSERAAEVESLAGKIKVLTLHDVCIAIVWITVSIEFCVSYRESYCGAYKSCFVCFVCLLHRQWQLKMAVPVRLFLHFQWSVCLTYSPHKNEVYSTTM